MDAFFTNKKNLKNGWMAPHTGIILRRDVIKEIGSYDTSFKISPIIIMR